MTLIIRYHAHHLELSGYGRAAAGYLGAIERYNDRSDAGIELDLLPIENPPTASPVDVAIYHTTPARLATMPRSPALRHVALTTWETEPLPPEHAATLAQYDAVIVPSIFCKSLIRSEGLETKTHVVPHAFDPEVWVPRLPDPLAPRNDVFTFYSIGAWGERKNTLGLLKAYLHAFRKIDRVRLVLVVDKVNLVAIQSLIARSGIPRDELPGLVVPDHRLSDDEIFNLHRDGNCFVTATRSEGFGLPIFEAVIMGKPVISPGWGGHREFLEGNPQWKHVWHFLTPVFPGEDELTIEGNQATLKVTLPRGANCKQVWAEPSLDRLAFAMRMAAYDYRQGALSDNHDFRAWYERRYSYETIGEKLINTLKEICGQ